MEAAKENEWMGDVSTIRRGWVDGRNASARDAVEAGNVDYVVWVDDDVNIIYPDALARLVRYNEDFVTGVLFQKLPPYYPLISMWNREKEGFSPFEAWPENTFLPVDGCGFGICVTSTALLRKIQALPSFEKDGWFNQIPGPRGVPFSEDFSFCLRAKEAGVQLYCDTAILLEHQIGPEFASVKNHKAAEAARRAEDGKL
jgi:GT2 family glycosyltransferase